MDVVDEAFAEGEEERDVFRNLPRQRKRRTRLKRHLPKHIQNRPSHDPLNPRHDPQIQHRQPDHSPQFSRIPRRQRTAPAKLDALGETGHADVEEQRGERGEEPEEQAKGEDAAEVDV